MAHVSYTLYTFIEVEAALCAWEWISEMTLSDSHFSDGQWVEYRDNMGSAQLRGDCIRMYAPYIEKVLAVLKRDHLTLVEAHAFDWEIVPAIMETVLVYPQSTRFRHVEDAAVLVVRKLSPVTSCHSSPAEIYEALAFAEESV
jgi:hypothetical protein